MEYCMHLNPMAKLHTMRLALLIFFLVSLFAQFTCSITESKEDKIPEQKPTPIREIKYPTPCIKSVICNNVPKTPNEIHFGDCWCCIFKGECYSSKFICTIKCLLESRQAKNRTSSLP
ncbi:uncharacterized protein LOC131218586 isoform X1 [Magnolia sinica]|uniref:uncharacterized protein LOC131218586 isoform X1 n=1 Tax=Magnolia sinica TaxID=86752 RepID=UPI0026582E64|nr:uncharacterized protein LOC131218586 isoform X1 [Magnolia sinica]